MGARTDGEPDNTKRDGASPSGHAPPLPRPSVPSMVPPDEEPEDTLATALAPLRAAESGISLVPPPMSSRAPISFEGPSITVVEEETLDVSVIRALPSRAEGEQGPVGLAECLAQVGVALIETDGDDRVISLNVAAERLTGWPAVEACGAPVAEVFRVARAAPAAGPEVTAAFEIGAAPPEHTALLERRDGQVIPIRHAVGAAQERGEDADPRPGRIRVFRDVNAQQFLTLQLARQARYDTLTGLLNRHAFSERIDAALAESRRRGVKNALCFFDLDHFRLVNATCGHEAGDDLLQWVATRLHEFVGPSDSVGRIGGDEFALLFVDEDPREAERVAREVQRRLLEFRFGWQEKTFAVGASFGLVCFGAEFGRTADVLGAADHACRMAKENGRGRIQIYLDQDDKTAQTRRSIQWVAGMQKNLEEGRLRLFAQGIHPLQPRPGAGTHFEVLVRLVREDGKLESPVNLIQAAENSGMMDSIDRFVVKQALRMIGALPQQAMRRLDTCAINLSGISLLREGLLDYIVAEMQRSNVPPSKICFEITETATLANLGEVLWLMQELGAMGCRFAIDDFGSGHASYGYIENLPVDYVKIDGVFVRDLPDNPLHRAIVESVHRIGCTLGIRTVAESVETQPIADLLAGMGIHYAQGWLFSKPKPMGEVLAALDVP